MNKFVARVMLNFLLTARSINFQYIFKGGYVLNKTKKNFPLFSSSFDFINYFLFVSLTVGSLFDRLSFPPNVRGRFFAISCLDLHPVRSIHIYSVGGE